jgi:hypothetical protein
MSQTLVWNSEIPKAHANMSNPNNPVVFFDVSIGGHSAGRIIIEVVGFLPHKFLMFSFGSCSLTDAQRQQKTLGWILSIVFWFFWNFYFSLHSLFIWFLQAILHGGDEVSFRFPISCYLDRGR